MFVQGFPIVFLRFTYFGYWWFRICGEVQARWVPRVAEAVEDLHHLWQTKAPFDVHLPPIHPGSLLGGGFKWAIFKKPGWLGYKGDEILPSYIGIIVNHYKDPF